MPPKAKKPFTSLAKTYSHPPEVNPNLDPSPAILTRFDQLKSGLTPSYPQNAQSATEENLLRRLERYQRARFRGATTAELHALESFAPLSNLEEGQWLENIPLDPLFAKEQWLNYGSNCTYTLPKHMGRFPIMDGSGRYWDVDTPEVWETIQPGLRLATIMLRQSHICPWWDALLFDKYPKIADADLPNGGDHYRFTLRAAYISGRDSAYQDMKNRVTAMQRDFRFRMYSGSVNPHTGLKGGDTNAETEHTHFERATIWIAFEIIAPLFNPAVSPAERILCHFKFAITILHEFTHALFGQQMMASDHEKRNLWKQNYVGVHEPYFEKEKVAELGFSMEYAMFGNLNFEFTDPVNFPIKGLPNGGFFQSTFSEHNIDALVTTANSPVLKNGDLPTNKDWRTPTFWPVPLKYFSQMKAIEFWNNLRIFSIKALHMGPKITGYELQPRNANQSQKYQQVTFDPGNHKATEDRFTEEQNNAIRLENERRFETQKILYAFRNPSSWQNLENNPPAAANNGAGDMGDTQDSSSPRFDEIRKYIIDNRGVLAFGTMHFSMGEHVLLSQIVRHNQIKIQPEELRAFLKMCDERKDLFVHSEIGVGPKALGVVRMRSKGWPDWPQLKKLKEPGQPWLDRFDRYTLLAMQYLWFVEDYQWDFDIDKWMEYTNLCMPDNKSLFNMEKFRECIYHYARQQ